MKNLTLLTVITLIILASEGKASSKNNLTLIYSLHILHKQLIAKYSIFIITYSSTLLLFAKLYSLSFNTQRHGPIHLNEHLQSFIRIKRISK